MKCVSRVGLGAHVSERPVSQFTFIDDEGHDVKVTAATDAFETGKTYVQEDLDKAEIKPVVKTKAPETEPEEKSE